MMRLSLFLLFFLGSPVFAQGPTLAVDRVDKFTKERIRETSLYTFTDAASGKIRLHFSARRAGDQQYLQINIPIAVTVKKNSPVVLTLAGGSQISFSSQNDVISLGDWDVNKRMIVCPLNSDGLAGTLLTAQVSRIKVSTANKGDIEVSLAATDRSVISKAFALLNPR